MSAPLRATDLIALAPIQLLSHRQQRYLGDTMDISLDAFDEQSRSFIRQLYAALQGLCRLLEPRDGEERSLDELYRLLAQHSWQTLIARFSLLSLQPDIGIDPLRARQVLHDIRGGALQALVLMLQMLEAGLLRPTEFLQLWFLTRDHLKIMRNAVAGIDPPGAIRDEAAHLHHADLIIEKWQRAIYEIPGSRATIHVDSAFHGYIAERCLEFAALDRVIYNLINNAVRHAADGEVALALLPIPTDSPTDLRIAVANRVTTEQRDRLYQLVNGEATRLFRGGLTIGGSGEGLRICADFIQRAYGIASLDAALAGGYLGISLPDDRFIVWVHWPIVGE